MEIISKIFYKLFNRKKKVQSGYKITEVTIIIIIKET